MPQQNAQNIHPAVSTDTFINSVAFLAAAAFCGLPGCGSHGSQDGKLAVRTLVRQPPLGVLPAQTASA
jgi:hypothetical protein